MYVWVLACFFPSLILPRLLAILLLPKHDVFLFCILLFGCFFGPDVTFLMDSEVLQTSFS